MSRISPKTTADRFLHTFTGCHPDIEGNITLEPTNHFSNWTFSELNDDNDPEGLEVILPEDPDGYWVYCSQKDKGPNTMAAQNTEIVDLEDNRFLIEEPPVEGHAPANSTTATRLIAPPAAPRISTKLRTETGFAPDDYLVAYTWVKGRAHTEMSPHITVEMGNGQFLRVALPTDPPEGVTGIGIWVAKGTSHAALRLQKVVNVKHSRPESILIKSYKGGRKGPSENETRKRRPKQPKVRRKRGRTKGRAGIYEAAQVEIDDETGQETGFSDVSDPVEVSDEEADRNVHLVIDDLNRGRSGRKNTSHRVYVSRNGKQKVYNNRAEGSKARPQSSRRSKKPTTSGRFEEEARAGEQGVLSTPPAGTSSSYSSTGTYEEPDIIEPPSSPLDEAGTYGEGPIYISAGSYWVAIAHGVRGEETLVTEPKRIVITDTQVIKVDFPSPVNYFYNGQFIDLDRNGLPDSWDFTGTSGSSTQGSASVTADGEVLLSTNGPKSPGSGHVTPVMSQTIPINRQMFHAVGGSCRVTINHADTRAVVELIELDDTGAVQHTHELKRISATGSVDFQKALGELFGIALPGSTPYQASTSQVKFQIRFDGATRDGTIIVEEVFFVPHSGRPRKRDIPERGERRHSNPNPGKLWRLWKRHVKGIELPPVKVRKPPGVAPLATADFEDASTTPSGWTLGLLNATAPGLVYENSTAAAIVGSRGFRVDKNDSTDRKAYIHRNFGPDRRVLGVHFRTRVVARPSTSAVALGEIRSAHGNSSTGRLGVIMLNSSGDVHLKYPAGFWGGSTQLASNVPNGSVLDIELIVRGGGTSEGYLTVGIGVGVERTFRPSIKVNLTDLPANVVQVGPSYYDNPAANYDLHFDGVVVTEYGDQIANPGAPPPAEPIPIPDRPHLSADPLYPAEGFEGGALPSGWTATGSPTFIAGAKVDGNFGMRVEDVSAGAAVEQYLERTIPGVGPGVPRETLGFRAKVRVNARPTAGSIALLEIRSTAGNRMGQIYIDSVGDLWARHYTALGTAATAKKISVGLTPTTVVTIEGVVGGVGTSGGFFEAWVEVGSTGIAQNRDLYYQETAIEWSTVTLDKVRVGAFSNGTAPAASTTYGFDIDALYLTDKGEVQLFEYAADGTPLYQINVWFHPGQPERNDVYVRGLRVAVRPGEQYTCALFAKHIGVINKAYPYFFSAYDLEGNEYELGSLYGDNGCTGTSKWEDLQRTFTIPPGCYEMRMDSRNIAQGEFLCQALAITRGLSAIREITYPTTGQFKLSLDTRPPDQFLASRPKNIWLRLDCLVNEESGPDGSTSSSIRYGSSNSDFVPEFWTTDPNAVLQRNWAHFEVTLNSDPTKKLTPIVLSEEPAVECYTRNGDEQVSVLLRDDLSEFSGGVYLDGLHFPRELSEWAQWKPRGHLRRHRRYSPVGTMKGFTINAFTEEAMREIEEKALSHEFAIEARGRRFTIKFAEPIEFDVKTATTKFHNDKWHMWGTASVAPVEVMEIGDVPENTIGTSL